MIKIKNLSVNLPEKQVLNKLNLNINKGEIHVIMGPNGSGKSTLSNIIAGNRDSYVNITGEITFLDEDLLTLDMDEIAAKGVFLSFQNPVEIPGVSNLNFLKTSLNQLNKKRGEPNINPKDFFEKIEDIKKTLSFSDQMISRGVNEGFSGGEKKKNEIFQMLMIKPKFIILDEIDSGLDIDALKKISDAICSYFDRDISILIITHYSRILNYIKPNFVHILLDGMIVKSGDSSLCETLELEGYAAFREK